MALANDDLLIVQRHMESYKVTAGNLKDYVNAGDTQGTVTEISQGPGITLSPNPITSTGSVQVYLQANGGLLFNSNAIYVVTDNDTIHKGTGGVLYVKRSPFANEADHAKLADRATVSDTTVGNANSADYSNRVNVKESDSSGPLALTFTTGGNSVTGKTIFMDSNDLNFNAKSNILFSRGGFNGKLVGNADSATNATNAKKIYVTATNSTNTNYHLYFGSTGTAYRDVRSDSNLYYNPRNNTLYATNFSGNLTGVPFPKGTSMLFRQTTAPTGWTKVTSHNNKALRIVSGTAGTGGSVGFTTVFSTQRPSGKCVTNLSGGKTSYSTLSTSQMPAHKHSTSIDGLRVDIDGSLGGAWSMGPGNRPQNGRDFSMSNKGGSGSHRHSLSGTVTGTLTMNSMNFNVAYVDVIIATVS